MINLNDNDRDCNRYFAAVIGLITASLVLKLAFVASSLGTDDIRYFKFARKLATLDAFSELDHAASRLAFLGLVGVPGAWFDQIVISSLVNVLLATASECAVAYFLWTRVGREASLAGTLFLAFNGVVLTYAGTFLPDTLLALLFLVAILLTFYLFDGGRNARLAALGIGVSIGLAYSTKETGILLLPPVLFCVLWLSGDRRLLQKLLLSALIVTGFLLIWILECTGLWLLTGHFFYRYDAIAHVHNVVMPAAESPTQFIKAAYWNGLIVIRDWDLLLVPAILGVIASAALLLRGGRATVLALVIAFCGIYLVAGTSSLSKLVNLPFQERYVQPLLPLLALALGLWLGPRLKVLAVRIVAIGLLCLSAIVALYGSLERVGDRFFEAYLNNAAVAVQSLVLSEDLPLYVDTRTHESLQYLVGPATMQNIHVLPDKWHIERGFLLLHPNFCCLSEDQSAQLESATTIIDVQIDQRMLKRWLPVVDAKPPRYGVRVYAIGATAGQ